MDDKETGVIIPVSAVADKNSAKEAVDELSKGVLSSLKGGYIEIPAEIKVPIKGASSELEEAQKDVIKQWERTFKEGFSSSAKDLEKLTTAYQKFKKLAGQQHKAGTKQSKGISAIMGEPIQEYNSQRSAKRTEQKNQLNKAITKKSNKKSKYVGSTTITDEEIESNIKDETKRRLKGIGSAVPRGYKRNTGFDTGVATSNTVINTERGGSYPSNWARQMKMSEVAAIKWMKDSLKVYKDETKANLFADAAIKNGENKNDLTSEQKSSEKANLSSNQLALILGGLEKAKPQTSIEDFDKYLQGTMDFGGKAGKGYESIFLALNKTFNRYFSNKGTLGVGSGEEKGVGPGHDNAQKALAGMIELFKNKIGQGFADKLIDVGSELTKISAEQVRQLKELAKIDPRAAEKELNNILKGTINKKSTDKTDSMLSRELNKNTKGQENQTRLDILEHSAERVADTEQENIAREDAESGFNTDTKADELIDKFPKKSKSKEVTPETLTKSFNGEVGGTTYASILEIISNNVKAIVDNTSSIKAYIAAISGDKTGAKDVVSNLPAIIPPEINKALTVSMNKSGLPDLYRYFKDGKWMTAGVVDKDEKKPTALHDITDWSKIKKQILENEREQKIQEHAKTLEQNQQSKTNRVGETKITSSAPDENIIFKKIKDIFSKVQSSSEAERIMNANKTEQERMRAERINKFGLNNGRQLSDTGDIAGVRRTKELFGWNYKSDKDNKELFQDIKLTPGLQEIDTTKILSELRDAIQQGMFKAQTGGTARNLLGSMTGYLGLPSLEKSRAQAEGLNQVMANVRNEIEGLLQSITSKESTLRGMERAGTAKFADDGTMISGTSAAKKTFADYEEQKGVLTAALAEAQMVDDVVGATGGKITSIIKQLGFVMPELMQNNTILQNINAGLDKSGKALKFQTRTGEVLNYSFQLMARSIGQMFKNWIMQLNPLTQIKKLFGDFASYDTKWQRTMNVIKYNIRRIVKPFMEWLAQQLVNMIGLVNALVKGIGSAFGQDWDLFDKDAANAEKIREDLEAAANVSAGFEELHDIGTDNSGANDLTGDIYTPQWEGLNKILEDIGKTIGNIVNAVSDWSFWNWLALAGTALVGFLALKWLINLFKSGNPLQAVAKGFSFLEKAVGWAILIWALTEFTKALTAFVECMKTASWDDIVKSLLMLGGAFAELFLAAGGLMYLSTALGVTAPAIAAVGAVVGSFALFAKALTDFIECMKSADWEDITKSLLMLAGAFAILVLAAGGLMVIASGLSMLAPQMLGLAVVIAAFAPVIWALSAFVEAIKGLTTEDMINGLLLLAGAFTAIAIAIGVLLVVLSAAIASGVGALAILALAGVLAVVSLVILALAELVRAMGEAGAGIKLILEGVATVINSIGMMITNIFTSIGNTIIGTIDAIANGIKTVLEPILSFIDRVIGKIMELASTVAHEIGETIRTIVKTTGDVIVGIINSLVNAIPTLLNSILNFVGRIGPALENSSDAIMRTITKLINFMISGIEYMVNTLVIGSINKLVATATLGAFPSVLGNVSIPRFVPQYKQGTNYVPNDGLAYLHQGEAVVPKKYNQPLDTGMSAEEQAYMSQMISTMTALNTTLSQGIAVSGEFKQRGTDLVAVTEKVKNRNGNQPLNNPAFAR